uniref:P-type ATPase N-terminal domain-containing protein n=1 Tax=Ananas comosus var. bracteatus TaxID=296719 RepID=A0A6V7QK08_ANACO|nr:unnamed protein product [Ananas comosus var. bracteatus]
MARGARRRELLRWSKLYTFSCLRPCASPSDSDAAAQSLGGPGFSRAVHCNQPRIHRKKPLRYPSNYISTTKYNILTFLPKAVFEQFRRVANLYFLLAAILSLTPIAPFSYVSMIAPLAFVVGLSMAKEALEDWRRFVQDMKVNSRKVSFHKGDGQFSYKHWQKIQVGDVVKVEKDQFFPADLLLLSSSYEDGICYVETMNLDGETNLKVKRALEVTLPLDEDGTFREFKAIIRCEDPNPSLYTFVGNFEYERQSMLSTRVRFFSGIQSFEILPMSMEWSFSRVMIAKSCRTRPNRRPRGVTLRGKWTVSFISCSRCLC